MPLRLLMSPIVLASALTAAFAVLGTAPVEAQPAGKVWRLGWLADTPLTTSAVRDAFVFGLREAGFVEGRNLVIETRYAHGRNELFDNLAMELVALNVDTIVTTGTPATQAAKRATSTIPVVMTFVGDPVGSGLVASLARPGRNLTGIASSNVELSGKWLELLKELSPNIVRVAVLWNPTTPPHAAALRHMEAAARVLGLQLQPLALQRPEELDSVLSAVTSARVSALLPVDAAVVLISRKRIIEFTAEQRLLAIYPWPSYVEAGGLVSYGPSVTDMYARTAAYVARIFGGTRPADLPVEQPTRFDLVINMRTARALRLTVPASLLVRAARVLE